MSNITKRLCGAVFYLLLASYIAFILWLPVFPSQDGPVHLYYASVASSLLHHETTYSSAFQIKHILPPYSLHTYILIAAMKFMSPVMADKFLVCLCVLVLALGFRAMAFSFGPSAWATSLLALPFFLHRYLFMGFYNYSLSIGIAFLAIAVWNRGGRVPSWKQSGLFLALVGLLLLTHPVSLAILLVIIGMDVLYRMGIVKFASSNRLLVTWRDVLRENKFRLLLFAVAGLTVIYVGLYVNIVSLALGKSTAAADFRPGIHLLRCA